MDVNQIEKDMKSALESFRSSHYEACVDACKKVIQQYSLYLEEQGGKKASPHDLFENLHFVGAWLLKGFAIERKGLIEEANQIYKNVPPDKSSKGWCFVGKRLSMNGESAAEASFKCYDRALEKDPDCSEAWREKGALYEKLQQIDKAKECYRKISLKNLLGYPVIGVAFGALMIHGAFFLDYWPSQPLARLVAWGIHIIFGLVGAGLLIVGFQSLFSRIRILFRRR